MQIETGGLISIWLGGAAAGLTLFTFNLMSISEFASVLVYPAFTLFAVWFAARDK